MRAIRERHCGRCGRESKRPEEDRVTCKKNLHRFYAADVSNHIRIYDFKKFVNIEDAMEYDAHISHKIDYRFF